MKKNTVQKMFFGISMFIVIMLALFLLPDRVEAAAKKIPVGGTMVKVNEAYVSRKSNSVNTKTVFYKAKSKSGTKKTLASIKKRVEFAVTDGNYIYFDTGENAYGSAVGRYKAVKIWKMSIATGKKTAVAVVKNTDTYGFDVEYVQSYGKYVYFYLWSDIGNVHATRLVQVNLSNGSKKEYSIHAVGYQGHFFNSRYMVVYKASGVQSFIDFATGKKTVITKNGPNVFWSDFQPNSDFPGDPLTLKGEYVYYFEKSSDGKGALVGLYNMKTQAKKYLTGVLPHFKADPVSGTFFARAFPEYAEYSLNNQFYRYYYASKKELKISQTTSLFESNKVELSVWAPQEDYDSGWIYRVCEAFRKAHPEWVITYNYFVVAEGDAKAYMDNPEGRADVYMYANDQIPELVSLNALKKLQEASVKSVKEWNSSALVNTVTYKGGVYGIPMTSNAWFMYYNKKIFSESDVKSLGGMLKKGKVSFPLNNSWYFASFYLANGCTLFGKNGTDASQGIRFGGDAGTAVTKYLVNLVSNKNFVNDANGSGLDGFAKGKVGAFFSGAWDYKNAVKAIGTSNLGICAAPTITINGEKKRMKAFLGCKAVGVNPYTKYPKAAEALALYMGSAKVQKLRFTLEGTIPTNGNVSVGGNALAKAQMDAQSYASVVQPVFSEMSNYWDPAAAMANEILDKKVTANNAVAKTKAMNDAMNGKRIDEGKLYVDTIAAYDNLMKKGAAEWHQESEGRATYYAVEDIDGNGIKELILRYEAPYECHMTNSDSGMGETTAVYTIKDGEVKAVIKANYGQTGGRSSFVRIYRGSNLINRGWSHEPLDHIFYNYHDGILDSQPAISMTGSDSMEIWWMQYEGFEGQTDQGSWMAMYNSLTGNDTGYSMTLYKP